MSKEELRKIMKKIVFSIIVLLLSTNCFAQMSLSEAKDMIKTMKMYEGTAAQPPTFHTKQQCPSCNKVSVVKNYFFGIMTLSMGPAELVGCKKYLSAFNCEHCNYIKLENLYYDKNNVLIKQQVMFEGK